MMVIQVNDKEIALDEDGYLTDFTQWFPEVAEALAEREGIAELSTAHLEVIHFIRDYYERHQVAPMVHFVSKETGKSFRELHGLFSKQPGKRAAKLAGLPRATGCS
jgi:TusE/DsrC/DsvC family sulfur relay protein